VVCATGFSVRMIASQHSKRDFDIQCAGALNELRAVATEAAKKAVKI